MKSKLTNTNYSSPIYKKAMEIFTLSKHISKYLAHDLATSNPKGYEDPSIYFTGDIIQQSVSLAPEILKAESEPYQENREKHLLSISHLTMNLDKNCERLEKTQSNGKEFLGLLRNELQKFKKLQNVWMLTL